MINYIKPNWNIEEVKNLNYNFVYYNDENILPEYLKSGHDRCKISIHNYHEPNIMPDFVYNYIKPKFDFLYNVCFAFNYFKPSQYIPLHSDSYKKYIKFNQVDSKDIVRIILMLEDSSPGQILQIKDKCFGSWNAGDCFNWVHDDLHAFYNFSKKDRYAIQITGTIR